MPLLVWAVGMWSAFSPMIRSGFRLMKGGLGDSRLVNYGLEHSYQWLIRTPAYASFWDAPLYYPHPNVTAFTDIMAGLGLFYWPWRLVGLAPDTAFQLWLLTVFTVSFLLLYVLLRRSLHVGVLAASVGAYVGAFGNIQMSQWGHPQLLPKVWVILCVIAVFGMFSELHDASRSARRNCWIGVFFASAVLQVYSAFYALFFFGLVAAAALIWSIAMSDTRAMVLQFARQHRLGLLCIGGLAVIAIAPMVQHYLITATELGLRAYRDGNVARPASWLLPGPRNYVYGWLQQNGGPFAYLNDPNQRNGLGIVTSVAALAGLAAGWRYGAVRVVVLATTTVAVCGTMFGDFSLWAYVHAYVPGGGAIRAIGRIGMILLFPVTLGVALILNRILTRGRFVLAIALAVVCGVEQAQRTVWTDKYAVRAQMEALSERVGPACEAFLLVCDGPAGCRHVNDDAAWVGIATGIPTVNGRYGNRPEAWGLRKPQRRHDKDGLRVALNRWLRANDVDPSGICWVEYQAPPRTRRGRS